MKQHATIRSSVREVSLAVETGKRFGPYEVLAPIAAGGMGSVHLARKRGSVGRLYALKIETVERCPDGLRGIENEARLVGRLQHANIIPIVDMAVDVKGHHALVMDYLEGATLGRLIRSANAAGSPLASSVVLRIVYDGLLGLAALHRAGSSTETGGGIVHRDVAPANLLVGADGVTRLGDFGVAIDRGEASAALRSSLEGRIAYMAPERLLGETELDPRSDLFAFGVVLWEAIAGRRLFLGADDGESKSLVLAGVVPSLERFRQGGIALDAIVGRALAPRADDRFASAEEFLDAIEALAIGDGGMATTRAVAATVAAFTGEARAAAREPHAADLGSIDPSDTTNIVYDLPTSVEGAPHPKLVAGGVG